jgi:hypothetical protein
LCWPPWVAGLGAFGFVSMACRFPSSLVNTDWLVLLLIWDGLGVGANSVLASIRFAWGTIFLEHGGRHVCF